MKRAALQTDDLVLFFESIILPMLEYASAVWHSSLTQDQSSLPEAVQKRATRLIYGAMSYKDACSFAKLMPLDVRRRQTPLKLFLSKCKTARTFYIIYSRQIQHTSLRHTKSHQTIRTNTDRFKNSFIPYALNDFL